MWFGFSGPPTPKAGESGPLRTDRKTAAGPVQALLGGGGREGRRRRHGNVRPGEGRLLGTGAKRDREYEGVARLHSGDRRVGKASGDQGSLNVCGRRGGVAGKRDRQGCRRAQGERKRADGAAGNSRREAERELLLLQGVELVKEGRRNLNAIGNLRPVAAIGVDDVAVDVHLHVGSRLRVGP